MLLNVHRNRRLIRDGSPGRTPRLSHNSEALRIGAFIVQCCFTYTETVGLIGTGTQDGHLDFHTALELCASMLRFSFKRDDGFVSPFTTA